VPCPLLSFLPTALATQVMGRDVVKPDGVHGPRTKKALEDFQELFGMPIGGDLEEQLKLVSTVLRNEVPRRRDIKSRDSEDSPRGQPESPPELQTSRQSLAE